MLAVLLLLTACANAQETETSSQAVDITSSEETQPQDIICEFTDEGLKKLICDKYKIEEPITAKKLEVVTDIKAWKGDLTLTSLGGIENCKNLKAFLSSYNTFTDDDIAPLCLLDNLQSVTILGGKLTKLPNLSKSQGLNELNLARNCINDITELKNMTGIVNLNLAKNSLIELNGIENLKNLQVLSLDENFINDITLLGECEALQTLSMRDNTIVDDLRPLEKLKNLQKADINAATGFELIEDNAELCEKLGIDINECLQIEQKVKSIASELFDDATSETEKAFAIHNYVRTHISGELGSSETFGAAVFLEEAGVCRHGSAAFSYLAYYAGLECLPVLTNNHQWNMIKINRQYYHCDSLWDKDTDGIDYFCKSDNTVLEIGYEHAFQTKKYPSAPTDMPLEQFISYTSIASVG